MGGVLVFGFLGAAGGVSLAIFSRSGVGVAFSLSGMGAVFSLFGVGVVFSLSGVGVVFPLSGVGVFFSLSSALGGTSGLATLPLPALW